MKGYGIQNDDDDLPEFSDCVIAYIDLMGIKERIKSQYTLKTIWLFLKDIVDLCASNKGLYCRAFSDNIVICKKIDQRRPTVAIYDVLNIVKEIEYYMFHIEFPFVRGAIVAGPIYYNDDYVIGDALLTAYRIEQENAIFPRVVVDTTVLDLAKQRKIKYVIKDRDGLYFYDYMQSKIEDSTKNLSQAIRTLKANILWNLKINCYEPKIVAKMEWLVNYFNESCERNNIPCEISEEELNKVGIWCEPLRLIASKDKKGST